jgi:7-cyano-7-deazaguanine synthase in queuosine biosynthesis
MNKTSNQAVCHGYGRIAKFGEQVTRINLGGEGWLTTKGPLGPRPTPDALADLLDTALVVFRAERQLPKRGPTNPNIRYELTVPSRNPSAWEGRPTEVLQELLRFLGNAEWQIIFVQRGGSKDKDRGTVHAGNEVARVALLSGGLDSACGTGCLIPKRGTLLCSLYTRQKEVQRTIAASFGYPAPTQWHLQGAPGRGRSFFYRSFLFLSMAAVTAETWGSHEIVQCENGILASAIPPVSSLSMTRHAHPKLHALFVKLLESLIGGKWHVSNPLWRLTKREAVIALQEKMGPKDAAAITDLTTSCWHLSAPHVFGVKRFDGAKKHVNQQCGVCIPCIVRRTAIPTERFAFDLRSNAVRNHPKLGAHFLEYLELLSAIRSAKTPADFRRVLPAEGLELMDDGWADLKSLERLFRGFTADFFDTFF